MQSEIYATCIFQVKKCNFKPVALLLHSSMCLPGSGFSREAAVLLRLTSSAPLGERKSEMPLLAQAHRNGKNPSENFSTAAVKSGN